MTACIENFRRAALICVLMGFTHPRLRAQDKMLATGDPPLTEQLLFESASMRAFLLDTSVLGDDWTEYQRRVVEEWTRSSDLRQVMVQEAQQWRQLGKQPEAKISAFRARFAPAFLDHLRTDSLSESEKLLKRVHAQTYKLLTGGDVPLVQKSVQLRITYTEWLLNLNLTRAQRQEFQTMAVGMWKELDAQSRQNMQNSWDADWQMLQKTKPYDLRLRHPQVLAAFCQVARNPADHYGQWALRLFEAAHKAGSERNPIIVPGNPALTQEMLDRYSDYAEFVVDMSFNGIGFTEEQHQEFQELLVKEWRKKDQAAKEQFTNVLKDWSQASTRNDAERGKWYGPEHRKLLAQIESPQADEAERWLSAVHQNELQQFQKWQEGMLNSMMIEDMRHRTVMGIIKRIGPSGHWDYNPINGKYDRWTPSH